jgi:squalene-associated FAD-dependent desaturase
VSEPRVVVVGGGLAGLSAAVACADGGARVTLLEARPRLGGATFSFRREGLWVDNGQHVFLRCCTAYRRFLSRVGAEDMTTLQRRLAIPVLSPDGRRGWLRRSALPAPLHLAGSIARYPFLSLSERARAGRAALALARLNLGDDRLDERTFEEWLVERRQSPAAVNTLWNLIALPTLNLPASSASLALAAKVFQTGLLTDRAAADIGYATAPLARVHGEAAARSLARAGTEVRVGEPVQAIEPGASSFDVVVSGERLPADAVILAVPHDRAPSLLPPAALPRRERLAELGSSPIVNVHVVYDRRVTDLPFAAGIGTPVQWVFDRTKASGLADGQYLAVSVSGADREIEERTEDLKRAFLPALARLFPEAGAARVESFFVTREHAATFRQAPGTRALRPGTRTRIPRLYLAGAWTDTGWPATMEGAVRSGLAASREALIAVGRTRRLPQEVAA